MQHVSLQRTGKPSSMCMSVWVLNFAVVLSVHVGATCCASVVQREVVEGKAAKLEAEGWQAYLEKMKAGKPEKKALEK